MGDNYFSSEEKTRIINLFIQSQHLRALQIQQLSEQIQTCKDKIIQYCELIYNFKKQLRTLIPTNDEKFIKKSAKLKWIKIYFDKSKIQYQIHEDYCTYLIYNKKSIQNIQEDEQQHRDVGNLFETIVSNYICDINQLLGAKFFITDQNLAQEIQMQINELELNQIIEILNELDDILSEEDIQRIKLVMKSQMQNLIEKEYQNLVTIINTQYKEFIQQSQIVPSYQSQKLMYSNFGDGLKNLSQIENQLIIREIDENQLNNLQIGLYNIKLKKKMIIILEITKKQQQNAYIINQFQHYKDESIIIEKIKTNFKCYYLRTIKLKKIQEAYLICKYLKNKKLLQQNKIMEFYLQESFKQIDDEINQKIQKFYSIQEDIANFVLKIIPESQNLKDFYSKLFVQRLYEKNKYEFNLIEKIQFIQNVKSLEYKPLILGAVLENENQLTQGIVLYLSRRKIYVFINNSQGQQQLSMESNKKVKIINTKVKEIHVDVTQFYVSLILKNQNNNVLKLIKQFLEQQNHVWINILKFLD